MMIDKVEYIEATLPCSVSVRTLICIQLSLQ